MTDNNFVIHTEAFVPLSVSSQVADLHRADISIQPNSGSNVLITANGSISDASGKSFTVPKGTNMKMTCGTIK